MNAPPAGRVVVVGSANVDYIISVARRPEPGETVGEATVEVHGGGKGANQALAAARSGARAELVARLGDDAMGESRLSQLADGGVDVSHVRRTAGTATGLAFITLTPDGENSIIVAPGANAELSPADIDDAAPLLEGEAVLLAQLEVPLATVERAAQRAGRQVQFVLNCSPFRSLPPELLARVDVLVVNELEAAALAGRPVSSLAEARDAGRALVKLGPKSAVITLGAAGSMVVDSGATEHVPAPPAQVVDTTGAGDAFAGALAARLAAGYGLIEAAVFGGAVGSATTERRGAGAVVPHGLVG